jgi:hypothetical protein
MNGVNFCISESFNAIDSLKYVPNYPHPREGRNLEGSAASKIQQLGWLYPRALSLRSGSGNSLEFLEGVI